MLQPLPEGRGQDEYEHDDDGHGAGDAELDGGVADQGAEYVLQDDVARQEEGDGHGGDQAEVGEPEGAIIRHGIRGGIHQL